MLWQLFSTFLKIGGFTIGGGYAMIPLIEREVVTNKGWIEADEFLDLIAVAQSAPGIIAINSALVVGYKAAGFAGAAVAALGAALPSFIIILFVAKFLWYFKNLKTIKAFMDGAGPVVVALLIYAAYSMGTKAVKERKSLLIGLIAFGLSVFLNFNPIILIILGGLAGYLIYYRGEREGQRS